MFKTEKSLVSKLYLLEKFPGKGGWTYARIPEILPDKHAHFGWVRVNGFIDDYKIEHYHLMPMGNGSLFLPVKAEIRESIKKQAGDTVYITLYLDDLPVDIPEELMLCFIDMPGSLQAFKNQSEAEQIAQLQWIYAVKKDETKVSRINAVIQKLVVNS
ncbi:MAG: hypothetical protein C0446_05470 [Chitinophaga sp.]|jgi:hypothetical protein|nr:hypothetical protein [Chitinophaga sp.]